MDERSEKLCLEEISHIVCDADKKVRCYLFLHVYDPNCELYNLFH